LVLFIYQSDRNEPQISVLQTAYSTYHSRKNAQRSLQTLPNNTVISVVTVTYENSDPQRRCLAALFLLDQGVVALERPSLCSFSALKSKHFDANA